MSPEEIEKKVNKEKAKLFNAPYKDQLPESFSSFFKKALFHFAPASDNLNPMIQKEWISKPDSELTFNEVCKMVELIVNTPRYAVFQNIEEASDKLPALFLMFTQVQNKTNDYSKKLENIKIGLENMTGTVKPQKSSAKKNRLAVAN